MSQDSLAARLARRVFATLIAVISLVLIGGGLRLVALGGSPYYLVAGIALAGCAMLTWRRHPLAAPLYASFLVATAAWSLWEGGFDRWALGARLMAPAVLGLAYLFVAVRGQGRASRFAALVAPALLVAIVGMHVTESISSAGQSPVPAAALAADTDGGDWSSWGRDPGGTHFSPLGDLNPANVAGLEVAWTYRTGIPADGLLGNLEVTPLKIGNRLYICNNMSMVDALEPETGKRIWRFDPKVDVSQIRGRTCRGVAYHEDVRSACPHRIITATLDAKLWALDARTGRPCADFGQAGSVDLGRGMGPIGNGYYFVTSAPTIAAGKIIVGGWVIDGQKTASPSGVVRAYDVVTGALAWAWDVGRPDATGEPDPGKTYTRGSPNSWAPMSADPALGLVYLPTGNATPDYYGAPRRPEFDRYSSSVVALDLQTGKPRWSFQTVHHDLWDYDVSSQPTLINFPGPKGPVPALVQPTKTGQLFILDRRTGQPLTQVTERPVPQVHAPGERLSPTQPFSTGMPSLTGPNLSETRMWGLTPLDQLWCRIEFRKAFYQGPMTPPQADRPSLQFPGFMGAMSWGGVSVDPHRGLLVVNSNRLPTWHRLVPRAEADRIGVKPYGTPGAKPVPGFWAQMGVPFAAETRGFLSPLGVPCSQPPYGMLTAIDLHSRKVVWERPLGTSRDSGPWGIRTGVPLAMGVPNFGGSIITAGGLIFIGATQEDRFRAIDLRSGATLWSAALPAGGQAVPMTYRSSASGRQFVVIAAGGKALLGTRLGDYLIAYALPKEAMRTKPPAPKTEDR